MVSFTVGCASGRSAKAVREKPCFRHTEQVTLGPEGTNTGQIIAAGADRHGNLRSCARGFEGIAGGLGWFELGALLRHRARLFARALPDVVAQSSALRQLRFILRIDFGFEVGLKVTERREGLGPGSKSPDSESLAHEKKKVLKLG
jgi:hypothetical protein